MNTPISPKQQSSAFFFYEQFKNDIFSSFNCHRLATITKIHFDKKAVDVKICQKKINLSTNTSYDVPQILEVPICLSFNNIGGLKVPLQINDFVLLCFNDRDYNAWQEQGFINNVPSSARMHDLNDAIAIPFIFNFTNTIPYDNSKTSLFFNTTEINLDDKINIKNDTESLKDLMTELITDLSNDLITALLNLMVEPGIPITSATATALNDVKAKLEGTLVKFNNLLK